MSYRTNFRPDLFAGQVILITGGGSGIGRCTAHELASLGASLALIGRKLEKLQSVADEIAAPGRVSLHTCDIRDEAAVRDTVAAVLARHGRIDVVLPGREHADLGPLAQRSADTRTTFEDHRREAAGNDVRCRCKAHRAGPDDGNGQ